MCAGVASGQAERVEPEAMDQRRFRLRDRIADHFGIGEGGGQVVAHDGASPVARSQASSGSIGMPMMVQGSPSTRSNNRSEEHTSELQSLMRISYAVFCL